MKSIHFFFLAPLFTFLISCTSPNATTQAQSETLNKTEEVETSKAKDTTYLHAGYTYWWGESGPFLGLCGSEYSIAFTGTITNINTPVEEAYVILQRGVIEIEQVLKVRTVEKQKYKGETFFVSDCFYNTDLQVGDKVMVFCYEYEGDFSIPSNSVLKIDQFDTPVVQSIKTYIEADQNPLVIKEDVELWEKQYGLGEALSQNIACKLDK